MSDGRGDRLRRVRRNRVPGCDVLDVNWVDSGRRGQEKKAFGLASWVLGCFVVFFFSFLVAKLTKFLTSSRGMTYTNVCFIFWYGKWYDDEWKVDILDEDCLDAGSNSHPQVMLTLSYPCLSKKKKLYQVPQVYTTFHLQETKPSLSISGPLSSYIRAQSLSASQAKTARLVPYVPTIRHQNA